MGIQAFRFPGKGHATFRNENVALDMVRHSTRNIRFRVESGEEVRGVMESTESLDLSW